MRQSRGIIQNMKFRLILLIAGFASSIALADQTRIICFDDENGQKVCGDNFAPEDSDKKKKEYNDQGVAIGELEGRKTEEELLAEAREAELLKEKELQRRHDRALLATYQTVEEILMHRDRRVELWQAQSRVTELYLRNLERRHGTLLRRASVFQPYAAEQDAPMVDPELQQDIWETEGTIERHQENLQKFEQEEQGIRARFQGDIERFKVLKGIQ